ncbi:MAG: DUF4783 domain-containing protein [Flavobacteriaceae bacterium]|nr:DUF4783 domain-containing protein [Flavobacteriaceae bacterium]
MILANPAPMKNILLSTFLLFAINLQAQTDAFDDIAKQIKAGSAAGLSGHFNSSLELSIGDNDEAYSKSQAEMIAKDFFTKNPPKNFTINHKGSSGASTRYANGVYESSTGNFKVYILIKGNVINELRFER